MLVVFLIIKISTPFLNISWWLMQQKGANKIVLLVIEAIFVISFTLSRVVVDTAILALACTYPFHGLPACVHSAVSNSTGILIGVSLLAYCMLQYAMFWRVLGHVLKTLSPSKNEKSN